MKHGKATQDSRMLSSRVRRWLQPRRLATVGASGMVLGGGLFGVLSQVIPANAASFTVSTTNDVALSSGTATTCDTPCSLRAALQASNNLGGNNTINVPAGTYNLTLGELPVAPNGAMSVTINGAGSGSTIIQAVQPGSCTAAGPTWSTCFRVFDVDQNTKGGANITITGVTVEGGRTAQFGGAGLISGPISSSSPVDTLVITNDVFHDNKLYGTATTVPGGAISQVYGTITVSGSSFTNNDAGVAAGGAIDLEDLGGGSQSLSISNSTFSNNNAGTGGAVKFAGTLNSPASSITGSTFSNNTATSSGAAIDTGGTGFVMNVTSSTFLGNSSSTGGAIHNGGGTLNLNYSRLYNNSASTANGAVNNAAGATISANTDWWGSNAGPGTGANFTPTDWQVLTATASPNKIRINQSSTITGDLDHTHAGSTIAPSHHLPDGIPVAFANGSLGGVVATSGTLSSGASSTTYNAGTTGGLDNVPVTIDGQTSNAAIEVDQPPTITSANNATFLVGASQSCSGTLSNCFHVTATGYPVPTFSETGSLPTGVSLASNGTLSGNPATGSGGVYSFIITATNGISPDASQNFTLTVNEPAAITSANNTTFTTGQAGTFTVTSRGYPVPTINLTNGSLPSGVSYDATTHVLSGTPAAGTGGQYALQFTSHNGIGSDSVQSFTLTVDEPASIGSANATTFTVGSPGTFSVTTGGFPHPTLSDGGASLPAGVTFLDNHDGTATLAGTPHVGSGGVYSFTITAHNGVGSDATQGFTLTVDEPASVTSVDATTFTVGAAGTFTVQTAGYPTPSLSDGSPTLPGGVTFLDNGDGTATLSGTPAAASGGSYPFTITAHNGIGSDGTQGFTLTVDQAPAITSADNTTFTVGQPGTFSVTSTGFPVSTMTESGSLPTGVTFTDNHDGTATLAGTPANNTEGDFPITLGASNGVPNDASQNFTLHVLGTPSITSANTTTFVVGQAGTFTVTTTGSSPMAIDDGGATLPGGVTFTDNGDGTATLAGTPAAGSAGPYSFTITAANGIPPDATQSFTLQVNQAASITSAAGTTFTVGTPGTFTVTTDGRPTPSLSDGAASLPSGVTFVDNGDGTATLSGTPAAGSGGSYPLTLTAHNGVGSDATQPFTLVVDQAPAITSADATTFTVGTPGTFTVSTTGFPTPAVNHTSGTLPNGLSYVDNGDGTATLSGTPGAGTGGTYDIGIGATNGTSPDATQTLAITVDEAPFFTSADNTTFTVGTAGSFAVTTGGFPVNGISESGALPSGVTFVDNHDGTATLAGTPAAGSGGSYPLSITAHNGVGSDAHQSFTLTVHEAASVTSANAVTFVSGAASSFVVHTVGYPTPTLGDGGATLPSGVTFTDNGDGTATLAGTPAAGSGGSYPFTITAHNGIGSDGTQDFTLTVDEQSAILSANNTTFTVGTPGTFSVTTRGFPAPSLSDGGATLPGGVTFVDNGDGTATLSGTPAAGSGGVYPFTITAHNGVGSDATQGYALTVDEAASITSANATTFTTGHAGTFSVTTVGYPRPSLSDGAASLPGGVTFTDNGNGTATLAGTPGSTTGGSYPFVITAHNGIGNDGTQGFTLTVDQPAAVTSGSSTTFVAGSLGSFGVTATGYPAPSLSDGAATLPGGVTFVDNHNGTATLSGTPATGSGGVYHFTVTAHNGVGSDAIQSFTLTVNEASAVTSANTATFQVNVPGTFSVTTRGYPIPSVGETGGLPNGVSFVDNHNGTATLSGTPTSGMSGTYPLTITAHNGIGSDGTQAFTLIVGAAPTTTTVTGNQTPSFGSPVTFTAAVAPVAPATGTPAGSVTFAVDGTNTAVVNLVSGQAQWTASSLQPGAHTISALYGGQANTFKTSSGTLNVTVGCVTVYTGRINGSVTITTGSACINAAKISGGVNVGNGVSVSVINSSIGNGFTSNGAKLVSVCSTSLGGSLSITNSTGFVLVGSNNDDTAMPCPGNTVGGGVTLTGNKGGVELGGNPTIKGAVTVNNNVLAGTAIDAENGAPEIEGNTIRGSLTCTGNTPAPTNDGSPNTVSGGRYGQCSAARF